MKKLSFIVALLFAAAVFALSASAAERIRIAGSEARARGVDAYSVRDLGGAFEMQLFRAEQPIGSLWFSIGDGDREMVLRMEEVPYLHLRWISAENRFVLRSNDGATYFFDPDAVNGFTGTEEAKAALSRYGRSLELIGVIMGEAQRPSSSGRTLRIQTHMETECEIWDATCSRGIDGGVLGGGGGGTGGGGGGGGGGFGGDPWSCSGPLVRGTSYFQDTRSEACARAEQNAHWNCWNRYCTGCCRLYPCDAYCLVGDYLCATAGVTGQACGPDY